MSTWKGLQIGNYLNEVVFKQDRTASQKITDFNRARGNDFSNSVEERPCILHCNLLS
jgi:hypothetical protein